MLLTRQPRTLARLSLTSHVRLDPCRPRGIPQPCPGPPLQRKGAPLVFQVKPYWPERPSPETVVLRGEQRRLVRTPHPTPSPRKSVRPSAGVGADKIQRKRNRGLTGRRFPQYARRKAPIFRLPGPLHWPTVLPLPLAGCTDSGPRRPQPGSPGRQPLGSAGAAGERAAARAGGGLGPFGKSQALFSIVNKEHEISPSADASADTHKSYWGWGGGRGRENAISFPGRIPPRPLCGLRKGNFGGAGEEGKGIVGVGEGRFTVNSGPRGLI